ncbi:MAG: hypothetical protein R6X02_10380 [Enhygromyxa sp.]
MRRPLGWLAILALTSAALSLSACRNRPNLAQRVMDDPAHELALQRCGGAGQIVRPLIIEWPATDRASLEGRLRRGQVIVVRYEGCAVEVMRDCAAPQTGYDYIGITRKNDRVTIRTADELYVNMPLTAVNLEAKLAKAGELNVAMALVGNFEAQRSRFNITELQGRCEGATHVIAAAQVGAFEFYTGAGAEVGTEVEVESVAGVGARSTASREVLNADGDAQACVSSSPLDEGPPHECGALLRLELSALDGLIPTCQPGSVWTGSACVAQADPRVQPDPRTQPGNDGGGGKGGGGSDSTPASSKPRPENENETIARQVCEIQIQCDAEASGMLPPEGKGYDRMLRACTALARLSINDFTRPQARKCIADYPTSGCTQFATCVNPPGTWDDDDEPDPEPNPKEDDSWDSWGETTWDPSWDEDPWAEPW